MKFFGIQPALLFAVLMAANSSSYAQMECKCHSKQPAMKRMHETIGFNSCGNCHNKSENLMAKRDKRDPDTKARLATRIKEDTSCIPCHEPQGSVRKEINAKGSAINISGTLFCPKDKTRYSSGTKSCPKCGGNLLNISEVMERSRVQPSNDICVDCHTMEEVRQIQKHTSFNSHKIEMCLDCHKGHDDCGSCHH